MSEQKTTEDILASPASVQECVTFIPDRIRKVESGFKGLFIKEAKAYKQGWNDCRAAMLAATPTPPVSEGRKDAENSALKLARAALGEVQDLIGESHGVYGLHLNGDESPWGELAQGGRFERLTLLNEALAAIDEVLEGRE